MAKSKKLLNEIGWNLKLVDEVSCASMIMVLENLLTQSVQGISTFQSLEMRLENANSMQMKEKY